MANNAKVSLVFEIQQDGSLKLVTKDIEKAAAATDKLTRSQAAAEKAERNANNTREKGVIGTANSTKSFSKLAQTIGDGGGGLVGAYAGLAANAFAVSAAFNVLNSAAQSQSILQGLVVQGEKAGKTLTVLSTKIKEITRNAISSTEAMQAVTLGASAGISSRDLERITEVANNASLALGRSVPDSLNRMTLAITKMEPELVDELGLTTKITEASERYARQNNITVASMTQAQKQQALLNAWVEQGTLKYEGLAEAVDPNPYQQLAASFDDLTKIGLNTINFFLKPLVSILAASKGALLGLGVVFLSSIKGQILPGITGVSNKALKAAQAAKKEAIEALAGEKGLASGRRKSINEFIEASKEGIASTEQFTKAKLESQARIEAAEKASKRPSRPLSQKNLDRVKQEEAARIDQLTKIQKENTKASVAQAQAMGYAASEGVSVTNAFSKLKDTVKATGTSFTATYNANKTTEKSFKGLTNTVTSSAKGIAAAGKVAAVGFLNFLPVIGQVIAVVTILWELIGKDIWAKLTGRTAEVTAALDAFNATVESTSGKLKAYEKIQLSTAAASDRALASISNQMSTVYELAEAYTEVMKAVEEREKAEQNQATRARESRTIYQELAEAQRAGDREAIKAIQDRQKAMRVADRLGVSATSNAAKAFAAQSSEVWMDDEYVAAAQALEQLEKVMPSVADNFYAINGGVEEFNKKDVDEKLRLINDQLAKTSRITRNVESAFRALNQAIEGLNRGYIDFIKSLLPSTPYDSIVNNLQAVKKSITDTQIAITEISSVGGNAAELEGRLSEALTGIQGPARNMFDSTTRGALEYFDSIDSRLQNSKNQLEGMSASQDGYADKVREITELENTRRQILGSTSALVRAGISDYQELVTNAQIEAITREGNLAIAQAHLNTLQKQGVVTGEDARKQMQAQNAIIDLQAAQLEAQIQILEIDLDRERSAFRLLESNRKLLETFKAQTDEMREQEIRAKITSATQRLSSLEGKTDKDSLAEIAQAQSELATAQGALQGLALEIARNAAQIEESQNAIRVQEAQIENLRKQVSAMRAGMNTAAEINAAATKQDLANLKESYNLMRESLDLARQRSQVEVRISNSLRLGNNALSNEIEALRQNTAARLAQLNNEYKFRKRELQIEIELARSRGNNSQVAYYSNLLDLATERLNMESESLETQTKEEILNKTIIRNLEDYYSRLQDIVNIRQKLVDATLEEMSAQTALNSAVLELEVLRKGVTDTEAVQQLRAIREARDNLDRVYEEAKVKKDLIFLEFQLLKAKRAQSIADLNVARFEIVRLQSNLDKERDAARAEVDEARAEEARLAQQRRNRPSGITEDGAIVVTAAIDNGTRLAIAERTLAALDSQSQGFATQVANLDNVIAYWGNVTEESLTRGAQSLERSLELGMETAAKRLEIALAQGPRVTEGPLADFRNQQARGDVAGERIRESALQAGVALTNAEREARGEAALTTQEIRAQREALISLGGSAVESVEQRSIAFRFLTDELTSYVGKVAAQMEELGPNGKIAAAAISGMALISNSVLDFIELMKTSESSAAKWAAGLAIVGAMLSTISNILKASSDARMAAIDREIAAEEKRDGKSAASVEKIKALEKKKEETAKKSFNTQKKLQMAMIVIQTAVAAMSIAASLAQLPFGAGLPLIPYAVGMIAALGAAQLALVASQSYEGGSSSLSGAANVGSLSIGKRGDSVDLAKGPSANAGGEVGYLRGAKGTGSNASNFNTIGSAYGGELMRGYGNRGFVVGEKGPEVITPETPITVTPANENNGNAPINATFSIQALDASDVQRVLVDQRGNIIQMLRDAANASGQRFLEDVNVNVYTRPNVNRL